MVYIESASRRQKATYWAAGTTSTSAGQKKVQASIEIKVRWEDKEQDALNAQGETIRVDAVAVVNRDIEVGSIMWLGAKRDWTTATGNLKKVISFSKIPNIKGTRFRRVVGLERFSESLPTIET